MRESTDEGSPAAGCSGRESTGSRTPAHSRRFLGRPASGGRGILAILLLAGAAFLLIPNPFASGEVLLGFPIGPSVIGHVPLANLTAATTRAGSRCSGAVPFTSAAGTLLGTTSTRGKIQITLPAACRAHRQVFPAPLLFPAGTRFHGQIGLLSNSWTGNLGSLHVCVAQSNRGCLSRQLTITSSTAVPLSTNNPVLISGNSYGPSVETIFTTAGTATVTFQLAISERSATGTAAALLEQDWFQVVIVQN